MNWFITVRGQSYGPFTEQQVVEMLQARRPVDGVSRQGEQQWWDPRHHPPFAVAIGGARVPAPKRTAGKQVALLSAAGVLALVGLGVCSGAGSKSEKAATAKAAASREAARLAEEARFQCPAGTKRYSLATFRYSCEELIKKQLLSPKSAGFPGMFDGVGGPVEANDCSIGWSAWVDAKNAFGVELRRTFTCSYDPKTDRVRAVLDSL